MKAVYSLLSVFLIFVALPACASDDYHNHLENIAKNTHLNQKIVKLALQGYQYAAAHAKINKNILTIVDYSQSSVMKRMYVIDLNTDQLLMNIWVAHGHNTGDLRSTQFSNLPESRESSVGVFVTEGVYTGHDGTAMVINGLEKNINDNAKSRRLVVHAAPYVSEEFAEATGRMGRSFGCLAVNPQDLNKLISLTKNGSVIFSYAPEEDNDHILSHT